jgi:lipid-binding SYLF domain-containing protein
MGIPVRHGARTAGATLLCATLLIAPAMADEKLDHKVKSALEVYEELRHSPDREVPETLLKNCKCIAVIPHALKGAIGYGARYGQGIISCRNAQGRWSPISFLRLTGGSIGFQIGAEASDYVLFFITERGAKSLLKSKFILGGTVSVAAGPAGRSAEAGTDIKLDAEIYSYAKSKGLFAGVSLEGARLAPDPKANQVYYGASVEPEALLFRHRVPKTPASAKEFIQALP